MDRAAQGEKAVNPSAPSILIVEDSLDDLFILKRAFRLAGTTNPLNHVEHGQQALDYLSGTDAFNDRSTYPFPCLVLLDLKLPMKHGLDVLAWIKLQHSCRGIIVIILTSSSEDNDVSRAYDLGANAFLVKPASAERLTEIVRALDLFWLKNNRFRPLS